MGNNPADYWFGAFPSHCKLPFLFFVFFQIYNVLKTKFKKGR